VIVDAVDLKGRRYMLAQSDYFPEECVECGQTIGIGDEFFMRNNLDDGANKSPLAAALEALTYDAVCRACGESQLGHDAN
jgi:hypothetical protein